jgi:HTH-type transcriptional regulator/antitoxin HigA
MTIRSIKTKKDHKEALKRIVELWDADPKTQEGDELDVLATLVESYEASAFPIEKPEPIDAIKFRMDQMGLEDKDLKPFIGARSKVSEVLNRKRPLSLPMIRRLLLGLNIPSDTLIQEYAVLK